MPAIGRDARFDRFIRGDRRRRFPLGVTLTEVLVALFITGIGLLALLTLFPLGALELAQAIRDDRASHLQEVADELAVAAQEIETSVGQVRGLYLKWLQEGRATEKELQAIEGTMRSHSVALEAIGERVRSLFANLTRTDRAHARRVLALVREGQSTLRALAINLRLVKLIQKALDLSGG